MADKQGGETTQAEASSKSVQLREEIVSLVSSRLESVDLDPSRLEISRVLNKRRNKWRKRHKLIAPRQPEYHPIDPSLREEKESISCMVNELKETLTKRRREGFATARQEEREKGECCLETFSYWLHNARERIHSYQAKLTASPPEEVVREQNTDHASLIRDLESAISQAAALSEVKAMKHNMTPRLPPLQDRTLSGNILDASLGVFHIGEGGGEPLFVDHEQLEVTNGICSSDEGIVTEYMDAQLSIGKVVSVGQDTSYKATTEEEDNDGNTGTDSENQNETVVLRVDNESSDDTPGVGMEIVCGAASDLEMGPFVVSQSHGTNNRVCTSPLRGSEDDFVLHDLDATYSVKNHSSLQQQQQQQQQQQEYLVNENKPTPTRNRLKRKSKGARVDVVENSTDTDSDSQFGKILQIIERAPYELRIPSKNRNYSAGIRRRRRRTASTTPSSKGKK